ncbi:MAG: TAXI family TRAP transporter solute-binding subunit [Burkholderiaceae bacterium]|nr:TAXI family TRAP transporter solute-binding subunit [Burkholderiaceae bacterium]
MLKWKKPLFAGVLLSSCILTATGVAAAPYKTTAGQQTVAAGSIGGSWFVISTALFDLYSKNIDGLTYNIVPGGGVSNPISVQGGKATIGMGYTTNLFAAYNGLPPNKEKMPDIRAVFSLNVSSLLHPFILASAPVSSFEEIVARKYPLKVDTGSRGTGGELAAQRAMAAMGASYENIKSWGGSVTHSAYREAAGRMVDGHIDSFINDDIINSPTYVELVVSRAMRIMPLSQSAVDQLASTFGYGKAVIPANTYKGQTSDIPTISQTHALFVHKNLPDDLVYAMTKLAFENKAGLVAVHPIFSSMDAVKGSQGLPIPLHPGAVRYYREIGAIK